VVVIPVESMRSAKPAVKYPVVNQAKADGTRRASAADKTVQIGNNVENLELNDSKDFMNSDFGSSASSLEGSLSPSAAETVNIATDAG
jgi:hypothetical protein